jgi:ubiquinone/menaquinone biosynthesis C-methylase UbiE
VLEIKKIPTGRDDIKRSSVMTERLQIKPANSSTWWRFIAPIYSLARRLPPFQQILNAERESLKRIGEGITFSQEPGLDLGTGSGDSLLILPPMKRILLDASFSMLAHATGKTKVVARAESLPFPSNVFSFISAIGLIEYLPEPEKMFVEIKRVSKPGTWFLFTSSPKTLANTLRRILGAKLFLRSDEEIDELFSSVNFQIIRRSRTVMQSQWLVCKM